MSLEIQDIKKKLDAVSPSFCIAKWTTVTLHLESGTTHSCHHPNAHKIPLNELKSNPSALHNTKFKIEQRKKMINGERPSECDYCWRIEDLGSAHISDRILKSQSPWSHPYYDEILKNPLSTNFKPRYLEVSFSNTCNFKCSYCSADYSTTWEKEIDDFGNYYTRTGKKTVKTILESENPYIKAFWDWWPEIKDDLHTFRITGGEPLLSPNTFRVLESLIQSPLEKLNLAINTNLGAPAVLMQKFKSALVEIENRNALRQLQVFTSIDAYGVRAEYIRFGLKTEIFWKNLESILSETKKCSVTIMCTFNALSVTSFSDLIDHVDRLNVKYRSEIRKKPITIDISYLRDPQHQTVKVLPEKYTAIVEESFRKLNELKERNAAEKGIDYSLEVIKLGRILAWMKEPVDPKFRRNLMVLFYLFFSEHDDRRKTNFASVFPEMSEFWLESKNIVQSDPYHNPKLRTLSYSIDRFLQNLFKTNTSYSKKIRQPAADLMHLIRTLLNKSEKYWAPFYFKVLLKPYYFFQYSKKNGFKNMVPMFYYHFYYKVILKPYYILNYKRKIGVRPHIPKFVYDFYFKILLKPYYFAKHVLDSKTKKEKNLNIIINGRMKYFKTFPDGVESTFNFKDSDVLKKYAQESIDLHIIKLFSLPNQPGEFEAGEFDTSAVKTINKIIKTTKDHAVLPKSISVKIEIQESTPLETIEEIFNEVYEESGYFKFRQIQLSISECGLIGINSEKLLKLICKSIRRHSELITQINLIAPHDQRYFDFMKLAADRSLFVERMKMLLSCDEKLKPNLTFEMDIFNASTTVDLLKELLLILAEFKSVHRDPAVAVSFIKMSRTPWWSFLISEKKPNIDSLLEFIIKSQWQNMPDCVGFHPENIKQLQNIMYGEPENTDKALVARSKIDFIWKISQIEQSHGKEFLKVFPELKEIYDHCHLLSQKKLESEVFITVKNKLNSVGKGFCLAKWSNVTLHLESGTTHSCHHPLPHKIQVEELKSNPSALHNTSYKIEQRKKMIEGQRPDECNYCWNIEDLATNQISDRHIKSSEPYSIADFDEIISTPLDPKTKPRYLEVSFSNKCNLKCSYCSADYSSSWREELKKYGDYSTGTGAQTVEIYEESENQYIKAFWHWWPEISGHLNTLRVTGGEPLLSPNTFKLLDYFIANPAPNLNIVINSNLGVPDVLFNKFEDVSRKLFKEKYVRSLKIYTSLDAFGNRAEYIRHGLKHELLWTNVERCLNFSESIEVSIMCTFNALSLTSGVEFVKKVAELNRKYKNSSRWSPITIDYSYLRHPEHQSVKVLTPDYEEKMNDILKAIEENQWLSTNEKMQTIDIHSVKLRRILEWMKEPVEEEKLKVLRWRFYEFFSEHDRRRNVHFLNCFPEMSEFWNLCKNEYEIMLKQKNDSMNSNWAE